MTYGALAGAVVIVLSYNNISPLIQIRLGAPKDGHAASDVAGNVFDAEGVARLLQFAVAGGE